LQAALHNRLKFASKTAVRAYQHNMSDVSEHDLPLDVYLISFASCDNLIKSCKGRADLCAGPPIPTQAAPRACWCQTRRLLSGP
jgi:hypothetical protein